MPKNPSVSVIIPTYNRAGMVNEAIESVLNQTCQDFEIIIVDDGSTDNTRDVIESFSHSKIKYLYQENQRQAVARNYGISESKGKYIAFLDSDDLFRPNKLEKQMDFLDNNPSFGMVYTAFVTTNLDGNHIQTHPAKLSGYIYPQLLLGCSIATPSVMLRREVLDEIGTFDYRLSILEDIDMWLRIARYFEIGAIDEVLVSVRLHYEGNFVRNSELILELMPYILKKNFANNNQVGQLYKNKAYAQLYFSNGLIILNTIPKKLRLVWLIFLKGFARYPFHRKAPLMLGRLLFRTFVPELIRYRLYSLRRNQQEDGGKVQ